MDLSDVLVTRRSEILSQFILKFRGTHESSGMTNSILLDHLPRFLDEIVTALERDARSALEASASARAHGEQRYRVGFDLASVVQEYEILRHTIVRVLEDANAALLLHEFEVLAKSFNVGVAEAVTEFTRHRDAELRAALRAREELIEILGYDLRAPLGAIERSAKALRAAVGSDRIDPLELARLVRDVERSSTKMNRMLGQLHDLSHIEAGDLPMTLSEELVSDLLQVGMEQSASLATDKEIVLLTELVGADGTVQCDRGRVLQVLLSLIDNAIRFTPEGGAVIARAGIEEGGAWFSVRDMGPGIPEDQIPLLFERFFRAPNPPSLRREVGLGLAVARGLVRLHGGRLWVDTKLGAGSTFHFTLPGASDVKSTGVEPLKS